MNTVVFVNATIVFSENLFLFYLVIYCENSLKSNTCPVFLRSYYFWNNIFNTPYDNFMSGGIPVFRNP